MPVGKSLRWSIEPGVRGSLLVPALAIVRAKTLGGRVGVEPSVDVTSRKSYPPGLIAEGTTISILSGSGLLSKDNENWQPTVTIFPGEWYRAKVVSSATSDGVVNLVVSIGDTFFVVTGGGGGWVDEFGEFWVDENGDSWV